jgi:cellulose synthase/poly-beta-1,6-N-acetylglucosamine synthase-like glycosyltransferase
MIASKLFPFKNVRGEYFPFVSVIITAYNEEKNIIKKIENTLALNYPADNMEIIIGSDGSVDHTVSLAGQIDDRRIRVMDFKINRGKTMVQNDCVEQARGEIIVFTDAASFLTAEALVKLVQHFKDPQVGCVAGSVVFTTLSTNLTASSQGLYWKYERKVRELESSLGRLIGVDGPLYAIRKELYIPLKKNIMSDFISPLLVLFKGKKIVFEPEAKVTEEATQKSQHEIRTRRRITLRGLASLTVHSELLNVFRHPLLFAQIVLHKVIRWCIGILVLINFVMSLLLIDNDFYRLIFYGYLMLLLAAMIGYILDLFDKNVKIFAVPYYFILVNLAATLGIVDYLRKKQAVSWQPVR